MDRLLPLVITARLGAPLISDHPVHLDSLLTEAVGRRHGLIRSDALRTDSPDRFRRIQIPLASVTHEGAEVWCASVEQPGPTAPYTHHWVRRRDAEDEEEMRRTFTPGAGPDRNMMLRRDGYAAYSVRWYAIGHRREVRKALELVRSVGAKRGQGLGAVLSWEVEHGGDALSWLVSPEGTCRRHVPEGWLSARRWGRGAVSSPYFLAATQQRVPMLGSPVTVPEAVRALAEAAVYDP